MVWSGTQPSPPPTDKKEEEESSYMVVDFKRKPSPKNKHGVTGRLDTSVKCGTSLAALGAWTPSPTRLEQARHGKREVGTGATH